MQIYELFDILHTLVKREFQAAKQRFDHFHPNEVVVMKSPANFIVPTLRFGLTDVVEQSRPAKEKQPVMREERFAASIGLAAMKFFRIALPLHQILEHFECMVEVVFVLPPIALFHTVESRHFR